MNYTFYGNVGQRITPVCLVSGYALQRFVDHELWRLVNHLGLHDWHAFCIIRILCLFPYLTQPQSVNSFRSSNRRLAGLPRDFPPWLYPTRLCLPWFTSLSPPVQIIWTSSSEWSFCNCRWDRNRISSALVLRYYQMNMFFSPVAFIAGLDRIFRIHDLQNPGVAVGVGESTTIMSKFEYADDAALVDADAATTTARDRTGCRLPHWCSNGDIAGQEKGHAYPPHDARQLNDGGRGWSSEASACSRTFRTQRGLRIHAARWYDGGVTHRSRRGSLADRAVQTANRRAAEALLSQVYVGNTPP